MARVVAPTKLFKLFQTFCFIFNQIKKFSWKTDFISAKIRFLADPIYPSMLIVNLKHTIPQIHSSLIWNRVKLGVRGSKRRKKTSLKEIHFYSKISMLPFVTSLFCLNWNCFLPFLFKFFCLQIRDVWPAECGDSIVTSLSDAPLWQTAAWWVLSVAWQKNVVKRSVAFEESVAASCADDFCFLKHH